MRYLMTYDVAQFCPWTDGEVDELGITEWRVGAADWARVAALSVLAVQAGLGEEDNRDGWHDLAVAAGLHGDDLDAYMSLHDMPIAVSDVQWTNGRHRGYLIQQAGAPMVAVEDPEWLHPYVRAEWQAFDAAHREQS